MTLMYSIVFAPSLKYDALELDRRLVQGNEKILKEVPYSR